ncbi:MAG TPA: zf-TFIIB domain-containing protein [Victivallales bacterium]|nr:zf-TFIIB domain-containing protein [Victivallales bacterium]
MENKNMLNDRLPCPKCPGVKLVENKVGDTIVHQCECCSGIWLDKGELNLIAHPVVGDLEYCSKENIEEDRISEYFCPACKDVKMKKVNFVTYSDISMDYCEKCEGLWLDRGELDAIIAEVEKLEHIPESWDHRIMAFLSKLPF